MPSYEAMKSKHTPTTRTVEIIGDSQLADQIEEAEQRRDGAKGRLPFLEDAAVRNATKRELDDAQAELDKLLAEAEPITWRFRLRTIGQDRYEKLRLRHPPTSKQRRSQGRREPRPRPQPRDVPGCARRGVPHRRHGGRRDRRTVRPRRDEADLRRRGLEPIRARSPLRDGEERQPSPACEPGKRIADDAGLRRQLAYCVPAGIPFSAFLSWSEFDREWALSYRDYLNTICPRCGTNPWDWRDPANPLMPRTSPFEVVAYTCGGCQEIERRERMLEGHLGVHTGLVPYDPDDPDPEESFWDRISDVPPLVDPDLEE